MNFVEAIISKRDGGKLSRAQLDRFALGAGDGELPPEQLAAMLMAICIRGMDADETRWLTESMIRSGESWQLGAARPDAVDKHSTGGVGDTVSLVFAPLLAAVGVPVAMMAGRGLGHSQGTVDTLADELDGKPRCATPFAGDHAPYTEGQTPLHDVTACPPRATTPSGACHDVCRGIPGQARDARRGRSSSPIR